jgi:SAM-dependent methyltransferase
MELGVNYLYFLHFLDVSFAKDKCISLDYGCGDGAFINYANNKGYRFRGVDNYYDATNLAALEKSNVKEYIDIIDDSCVLHYNDRTFDFITSIQVFEHVEKLETVLSEIKRVLKDDGKILCSFPFKYSYIESHYRIPFSHWFKPTSKIRKIWALVYYKLGFGANRSENLSFDEWYKIAFNFIDKFCCYRTKREFLACCNSLGLKIQSRDKEALQYSLKHRGGLSSKILNVIITVIPSWFISFLLSKRCSVCLELTKTAHKKAK